MRHIYQIVGVVLPLRKCYTKNVKNRPPRSCKYKFSNSFHILRVLELYNSSEPLDCMRLYVELENEPHCESEILVL